MEKITVFLALYAYYEAQKDSAKMARLAVGIDKIYDDIVKDLPTVEKTPTASPTAPVKPADEPVKTTTPPPAANKNQQPPAAAKPAETKKEEPVDETLIEAAPFYPCVLVINDGKLEKSASEKAPRTFKVFTIEEAAKAANNAYPTLEEFELVIDELWEKACANVSNKEIAALAKKELGKYYPELKQDSDWYAKLVNPISFKIQLMKKIFGYSATDPLVQVARPNEPNIKYTLKDCVYVKPKPEATTTPAPTVDAKKAQEEAVAKAKAEANKAQSNVKTELKTVQTGKTTTPPPATPATTPATEEPQLMLDNDDEDTLPVEVDKDNPPVVNTFDNFNSFEKLIFEKYKEGAKLAAAAKGDVEKKQIQIEKRNEARRLIQSNFEECTWVENTADGKWNPKLQDYHNRLITEITKNTTKWNGK